MFCVMDKIAKACLPVSFRALVQSAQQIFFSNFSTITYFAGT